MNTRAVAQDWRKLAAEVTKRRTQLGMTQQDVQASGGPATATLRNIEGGHQTSYRGVILSRLEKALEWEPGSVDAILAGGEATPSQANSAHTPAPPSNRPREGRQSKTLGDLLVERGLRQPGELVISDQLEIATDRVITELMEPHAFDEEFKNRYLLLYSAMRREIFEQVRMQNEKPRDR